MRASMPSFNDLKTVSKFQQLNGDTVLTNFTI